MPSVSSFSRTRRQNCSLQVPDGVCQLKFSHSVRASSRRLSFGNSSTISCMTAICLRVSRLPKKVVVSRFSMRGSIAASLGTD